MTSFNELLASALAPITLISGVGLLMLSMSARYNHASGSIRSSPTTNARTSTMKSTSSSTGRGFCAAVNSASFFPP